MVFQPRLSCPCGCDHVVWLIWSRSFPILLVATACGTCHTAIWTPRPGHSKSTILDILGTHSTTLLSSGAVPNHSSSRCSCRLRSFRRQGHRPSRIGPRTPRRPQRGVKPKLEPYAPPSLCLSLSLSGESGCQSAVPTRLVKNKNVALTSLHTEGCRKSIAVHGKRNSHTCKPASFLQLRVLLPPFDNSHESLQSQAGKQNQKGLYIDPASCP